jgi:hypothetical protein
LLFRSRITDNARRLVGAADHWDTLVARRVHRVWCLLLTALGLTFLTTLPARAQGELRLDVVEVARSVDVARGGQHFLTISVDLLGLDQTRMRTIQPRREDFLVIAGSRTLPCRWLRGGTLPEDPSRLRFTLGFSPPSAAVRRVSLVARLPASPGTDELELRLTGLQPGRTSQERRGPGWSVRVRQFTETEYTPPALPASGYFYSKAGPVDARVYRKGSDAKPPERAIVLEFHSPDVEIYDPTLDLSASLLLQGGGSLPMLSALVRRDPSRAVAPPPYPPRVEAHLYFPVPARRATGAVIRLRRRAAGARHITIRRDGLPVPGG